MNIRRKNGLTENMASIIKTLFSPKSLPIPITVTWHNESDYSTQEEKVHVNQTNSPKQCE